MRGSRIRIGPGTVIDAFVKIKPVGGSGDVRGGGGVGASPAVSSAGVVVPATSPLAAPVRRRPAW